MPYTFSPMDDAAARSIVAWRYDSPYDVYNIAPGAAEAAVREMLRPANAYYAIHDGQGQLVAFSCFGPDARVLGGDYPADALDVGLGLRPDLTGRGLGAGLLDAILAYARGAFEPAAFRLTVAEFNVRARRVYEGAGFRPVQTFAHPKSGRRFVVLVRPA